MLACVEKIDAEFDGSLNEGPTVFFIQMPGPVRLTPVAHAAQADSGYFETSLSEILVLHFQFFFG
jgi:hypothetical protein